VRRPDCQHQTAGLAEQVVRASLAFLALIQVVRKGECKSEMKLRMRSPGSNGSFEKKPSEMASTLRFASM